MPNHVMNTMLVYGPEEVVRAAFALVWKPDSEGERGELVPARVDFNLAAPMPAELEGTASPTRIMSEEELAKAKAEHDEMIQKNPQLIDLGFSEEVGLTRNQADERIQKYGALNWYDWSLEHWGTKWNAYDCELEREVTESSYDTEQFAFAVSFNTAWSPPSEWISALLEKLESSTVTIEMISIDEGDPTPIVYTSGEEGYLQHLSTRTEIEVEW